MPGLAVWECLIYARAAESHDRHARARGAVHDRARDRDRGRGRAGRDRVTKAWSGYGEATPIERYDESAPSALRTSRRTPMRSATIRSRWTRSSGGSRAGIRGARRGRRRSARPLREARRRPGLAPARPSPRRAADVVDDHAQRPGRDGARRRAGKRRPLSPAQAEARRPRRPRRGARTGRAGRDRPSAPGRRQRVLVARRGARGAAGARGGGRPVLRAAAPRRRSKPGRS